MTRVLGVLGICGVSAMLAGCGPTIAPLTIEVRDAATHEPAANITVVADVPSRYHPFSVATILGETSALAFKATTDAQGRAVVQYVPGRPVRLGVLQPGWDLGFVLIDPEAVDFVPTAWHSSRELPKAADHQPEYRVETR